MSEPLMSEVSLFGCSFAPRNWQWCEGQLLAIAEYQSLYSLLGTNYGGDGRVTFGVPDLRGRTAIGHGMGPGLSNRIIGRKGGSEAVQLDIDSIPSHNHTATGHASSTGSLSGTPNSNAEVKCNNTTSNTSDPAGKVWGKFTGRDTVYADSVSGTDEMQSGLVNVTVDLSPVSVNVQTTIDSVTIGNTGGGRAHENMSPFLVVPYCICTVGLYPSRN